MKRDSDGPAIRETPPPAPVPSGGRPRGVVTGRTDRIHLEAAARLAWRGHGRAEPNPLVGCIIIAPEGAVVGRGFHCRFGGPHAEVNALRQAGPRARGATMFVTLEPCDHQGKTGPCTRAIVQAGVRRVVIGQRDPNPIAAGGAERLRHARIEVDLIDDVPAVRDLNAPFLHRVRSAWPWVIAKWAQTLDGRIATRSGASRWISSEASRRVVHRERGRADAILTGIGTILKDDPLLTARRVRVRRVARRVIIDPKLQTPLDAQIVRTADAVPTTIACLASMRAAMTDHATALEAAGVELLDIPVDGRDLPLEPVLRALHEGHGVSTVLTECGAGLLRRLFEQRLVNEAWVFTAPLLLGDEHALPALRGRDAPALTDGLRLRLRSTHQRGGDVFAQYILDSLPSTPEAD